ncbi:hypothetical protein Syun_004454 [Stephania yunnanensis]|uniref:Uncharacterized protein n=1 Tax=Stephania yunnanensis TaxID=152371 RepID=A0AAP0Q0T9_9MAGN
MICKNDSTRLFKSSIRRGDLCDCIGLSGRVESLFTRELSIRVTLVALLSSEHEIESSRIPVSIRLIVSFGMFFTQVSQQRRTNLFIGIVSTFGDNCRHNLRAREH